METFVLASRLRKTRRALDWTQAQLGAKAGLNAVTISRIEHGKDAGRYVYAETLRDLAQALGVSTDYLLGMHEEDERGSAVTRPVL